MKCAAQIRRIERAARTDVETQLAGLLRSGVLKRFESCWRACLETVERMLVPHEAFLLAWAAGEVPSRTTLREAAIALAHTIATKGTARTISLPDDERTSLLSKTPCHGRGESFVRSLAF